MPISMSVPLEQSLSNRLDRLARVTHGKPAEMAADAIKAYVELNEWQIRETESALAEADAGEFASDEESRVFRAKWGLSAD